MGAKAKNLRQALLILASLVIAVLGLAFTEKCYPGFLGMHGVFVVPLLPLYAVAVYYGLDFILDFLQLTLRGRGKSGEGGEMPAKRFSWLPVASLLLSSAGFFLPFVSIAGIVAGKAARRQDREGQPLRGIGMATIGLITGYLFLLLWAYICLIGVIFLISRHIPEDSGKVKDGLRAGQWDPTCKSWQEPDMLTSETDSCNRLNPPANMPICQP